MSNSTSPQTWLVAGAAGFIGMHVCLHLLKLGRTVVGIDNFNDYYDVNLKHRRMDCLREHANFTFHCIDIAQREPLEDVFRSVKPWRVIHLAAQAGVRHSLVDPQAYIDSNIQGFLNVLECCRHHPVNHLVYASSSSVYGEGPTTPFSEHHSTVHPLSLYAATKKSNELMAHSYSHLFNIPTTGLRFFTVYGPWGRPDMALSLFAERMLKGLPIDVFNGGNLARDFTYIDDIVDGVVRVAHKPATASIERDYFDRMTPARSDSAPYRIFNIGNGQCRPLMHYIHALETALEITAIKNMMPMQPGDVPFTASDNRELDAWIGFRPDTPIEIGVKRFAEWYRCYEAHKL